MTPESGKMLGHYRCYWARAGNREESLARLQRLHELDALPGYVVRDPDLAWLHDDPEFEAIVAEVRKRTGQD